MLCRTYYFSLNFNEESMFDEYVCQFYCFFVSSELGIRIYRLKSLLQLMAAAQVGRDVVFFTFGDKSLVRELSSFHSFVVENNCNVGQVCKKYFW